MSEEKYFVLTFSEDGDTYISELTHEVLLKRLNEDYYGSISELTTFKNVDLDCFSGTVIIKGKIVKPVEKKSVVIFEIE